MEFLNQIAETLPTTGIGSSDSTGLEKFQEFEIFGNNELTLYSDRIEAESIQKAPVIKLNSNNKNLTGFTLLITATTQFEVMNAHQSELMVIALNSILESADPSTTLLDQSLENSPEIPAPSPPAFSNITSSQSIPSNSFISASEPSATSTSISQRTPRDRQPLRRARISSGMECEQETKETPLMKRTRRSVTKFIPAMIIHSILSSPRKRATSKQIRKLMRVNFLKELGLVTNWEGKVTSHLYIKNFFQKTEFRPDEPGNGGRYYEFVEEKYESEAVSPDHPLYDYLKSCRLIEPSAERQESMEEDDESDLTEIESDESDLTELDDEEEIELDYDEDLHTGNNEEGDSFTAQSLQSTQPLIIESRTRRRNPTKLSLSTMMIYSILSASGKRATSKQLRNSMRSKFSKQLSFVTNWKNKLTSYLNYKKIFQETESRPLKPGNGGRYYKFIEENYKTDGVSLRDVDHPLYEYLNPIESMNSDDEE